MYICRDKDEAEETMNEYFSDDYVAMATFSGNSYAIVTTHVHTFLVDFVIKVCSMLEKSPHTCGGRSLRNASLAPSMHMLNAPQMGAAQNRVRRMIEVTSGQEGTWNCGGHGRGSRGGRHGSRGGSETPFQSRTDSRNISLTDGQQIEYHVSFNFPQHIFLKMKPEDKVTLWRERKQ